VGRRFKVTSAGQFNTKLKFMAEYRCLLFEV
jgi:hypothetical protein